MHLAIVDVEKEAAILAQHARGLFESRPQKGLVIRETVVKGALAQHLTAITVPLETAALTCLIAHRA